MQLLPSFDQSHYGHPTDALPGVEESRKNLGKVAEFANLTNTKLTQVTGRTTSLEKRVKALEEENARLRAANTELIKKVQQLPNDPMMTEAIESAVQRILEQQ